jgi:hypothetical protein
MRVLPLIPIPAPYLSPVLFSLAAVSLSCICLHAQTAPTTPAKPAAAETSSASGFSIETEMLTYRALESNSEAIACDVAAYLYGGKATTATFKSPTSGAACSLTGSGANSGVIVLPFDRSVFADFQLWRSDMQTMAEIEDRTPSACTPPAPAPPTPQPDSGGPVTRGGATTAGAVAGAIPGPFGAGLSAASSVLGLFASDHASSPVGGTIQDQAMMNDVSRELSALNVPVLMPSVYTPYALTSIDAAHSPFLIALNKLLHTRDCLDKGKPDPRVTFIDEFLASLSGTTSADKSANTQRAPQAAGAGGASTAAAPQPAASSTSQLEAILSADGLAQSLGADVNGNIPADAAHHVLLLKALESGGSVDRYTNIFGLKISYSGGSVGTYALFNLDGQLECSGNVFDYAGSVSSKKFQQKLRDYTPDPSTEMVFQHGSCRNAVRPH